MRLPCAGLLVAFSVPGLAAAQPADCPVEPSAGPLLPLSLDLAGRGATGQAYVLVPMAPPGVACRDAPRPPTDILRGEPGNVLGPPSRDLLRGPGTPRVWVETR